MPITMTRSLSETCALGMILLGFFFFLNSILSRGSRCNKLKTFDSIDSDKPPIDIQKSLLAPTTNVAARLLVMTK